MEGRALPARFSVAFSFAGEQRALVSDIAQAVENELGLSTVFLDDWYEHYIAGDDADLKLQEIYGERCTLAVVCVSQRYGGKPWTLAEHAAIRARQMKARAASDERERLAVLPIRVDDGEVPGILFNTIVPDVRGWPITKVVNLIVQRLRLIEPAPGTTPAAVFDWPEQPPNVSWPIADHSAVRAAFERLLTRQASCRILLVRGPSESGKSHITRQMLGNALHMPDLACGRFDFKGSTDMDTELGAFVQQLETTLPAAGSRLNERLTRVFDALKQRGRPTLLIFDTYNEATGDARDWMEKQLLPSIVRAAWLRVVVVGQVVPRRPGAIWETEASPVLEVSMPLAKDWYEYGKPHHPDLTLEYVEQTLKYAAGKASVVHLLLGPQT